MRSIEYIEFELKEPDTARMLTLENQPRSLSLPGHARRVLTPNALVVLSTPQIVYLSSCPVARHTRMLPELPQRTIDSPTCPVDASRTSPSCIVAPFRLRIRWMDSGATGWS